MGTRSLTHIRETENGKDLVCFYRQFDGYPSGLGQELAEFLKPFKIVNGFSGNDSACAVCGEEAWKHKTLDAVKDHSFKSKPVANGIGCLAAQLIAHVKDGLGNVYIYKPNTSDAGDEYQYVQAGHRTQCARCGLCNGAGMAKNIFIPVHGAGAKSALVVLQ